MHKMRRTLAIAMSLAALLEVGCGSSKSSGATGPGGGSGAAKQGGSLTFLFGAEPTDLFPTDVTAGAGAGVGLLERFALFDALVNTSYPSGKVAYRLAQSLTTADGGSTWTLTLKPKLVFSDGTALDAAAVKFNWDLASDPTTKLNGKPLAGAKTTALIASTAVVDARTLTIHLKKPTPLFPTYLAGSPLVFLGSPAAIQARGAAAFATNPVGAGAFKLRTWQTGSQMTFMRNATALYPSRLDQFTIRYIADETQRLNTIKAGGADIDFSNSPVLASQASTAGLAVSTAAESGGYNVEFNTTKAPFNDLRAREAIAYAFDQDRFNQAIFSGVGSPAPSVFASQSPFYSGVQQLTHNAAMAQQLLDQLATAGTPLSFTILSGPAVNSFAQYLQAQLASFKNVTVHIDETTNTQFVTRLFQRDFQLTFSAAPHFADPYPSLSNLLLTGAPTNFPGYSNPQLDQALTDGASAVTTAARAAAYRTAETIISQQVPVYFFTRADEINIYNRNTVGALPLINDGMVDPSQLWKK